MELEGEVDIIPDLCGHCDYRDDRITCPINKRDGNVIDNICYDSVMGGKPVFVASREHIHVENTTYARAEIDKLSCKG
ncbi:MAG TPA: hypothetical protein VJH92_05975 [Candidatus Nanoarchaeia archaeon]|nr:hypothetical protein [Candidatus Nanoarchaeia archaeon]